MELPSAIVTPEDSGAAFKQKQSLDVWACSGVNPLDMAKTLIGRVKENIQQPTMPISA